MDKDNNPTLKINEINEYYKSGDYPKYIITQITTGIDKFKSIKKEYDLLEEQLTQNIQSKEQDKKTKDDLWKITMLHLEIDTGEKALDELNNQLELIREWDCTRELMQPLYKIGNNLDRIKTKYKMD